MKKIAFLIMAHKNLAQVSRLVDRLRSDETDVFLHYDAKSNATTEDLEKLGVILTNERRHGALFGQSLIDIELLLLNTADEYARRNNIEYQYYCLLSGQDYLLKTVSDIVKDLNENYPKPFIDCTPQSADNWLSHRADHCGWYVRCHENIFPLAHKQKNKYIRKAIKAPFQIADKILNKSFSVSKELRKNGLNLYGGGNGGFCLIQ